MILGLGETIKLRMFEVPVPVGAYVHVLTIETYEHGHISWNRLRSRSPSAGSEHIIIIHMTLLQLT